MPGLRQFAPALFLGVCVASSLASCASTRYFQCQQTIQIANEVTKEVSAITDNGQTQDPQQILQAAEVMEEAALEMEALQLSDPQLQEYRQGFVQMYRQSARATRDFVKAKEKFNRKEAEPQKNRLLQATSQEQKLVTGINEYCLEAEP